MSFANAYFSKISTHTPIFNEKNSDFLGISVVIPCFDEPFISETIFSLFACTKPACDVEIIVIINASEKAYAGAINQNTITYHQLLALQSKTPPWIQLLVYMNNNLPAKYAGVGLSRKIGMDEACMRFNTQQNSNGIIVSLDADTIVETNYFSKICTQMNNAEVGILSFKHRLPHNNKHKYAIMAYELHLRYVKNAFSYIGYPFSHHTIGSAFCVKAHIYARYGGMNKKHAGEDFYFLHKLFPHCKIAYITTTVYPESRLSNRVPFGTGPALKKILESEYALTYNYGSFKTIKTFFSKHTNLYHTDMSIDPMLTPFLAQIHFEKEIKRIRKHSSSIDSFSKNFFLWFNAFHIVKLLNWLHTDQYIKKEIETETTSFLVDLGYECKQYNIEHLLQIMRMIDIKQL